MERKLKNSNFNKDMLSNMINSASEVGVDGDK